jgi:DNA-binding transcriptional LysR family regulator
MTAWLLVPVLRQWRSRHPEVDLDLAEFSSADRMAERIAAGGADIAVGPCPTATPDHVEVIGQEEVVVVASAGHRFADEQAVCVADIASEPFVHYTLDNGMAVWVDQLAAQHGVAFEPVLRTRSPRTAAQLAAAGMGVTIVSISALSSRPAGTVRRLRPSLRRDLIVVVAAAPPGTARNLCLVVTDLEAARQELLDRGVEVGPIGHKHPHDTWQGARAAGLDPHRRDYASFADFADPDGNTWVLQEGGH